MKNIILCISLILILVCLPTKIWGQYVTRENTGNVNNAVIIYTEGVFPGAVWPLGMVLRDSKTNATFRHTVTKGNGGNISANSKLPFRIMIAPSDLTDLTWSEAMGFTSESSNNLDATAEKNSSGCASYNAKDFSGYTGLSGWRLPTQRELQLIWLLSEAIDQAFGLSYPQRDKLIGTYWSSTEDTAEKAWYLVFGGDVESSNALKTGQRYKVRCVRDY